METQDMNVQSEERVKVVWLIKGIAKSKITLQPAQISEGNMPTRFISWREGEPRPVRVPWIVAKTKSATVELVENLQPNIIDIRRHVQWRDTSQRVNVSWMSRNTPAPNFDRYLTLMMPKRVSWECGDVQAPKVSWVKPT